MERRLWNLNRPAAIAVISIIVAYGRMTVSAMEAWCESTPIAVVPLQLPSWDDEQHRYAATASDFSVRCRALGWWNFEIYRGFLAVICYFPTCELMQPGKPASARHWSPFDTKQAVLAASACLGEQADRLGIRIWRESDSPLGVPARVFEMRMRDLGFDLWTAMELIFPEDATERHIRLSNFRPDLWPSQWRPDGFYRVPIRTEYACALGSLSLEPERAMPSTPEVYWVRIYWRNGRQHGGVEWLWRPEEIDRVLFSRYAEVRLFPKSDARRVHLAIRTFGDLWYERTAIAEKAMPEAYARFCALQWGQPPDAAVSEAPFANLTQLLQAQAAAAKRSLPAAEPNVASLETYLGLYKQLAKGALPAETLGEYVLARQRAQEAASAIAPALGLHLLGRLE